MGESSSGIRSAFGAETPIGFLVSSKTTSLIQKSYPARSWASSARSSCNAVPGVRGPHTNESCRSVENIYFQRMSLPQKAHRLTEAEYLKIERAAEFRSEFYDGEMFAMAGGTLEHSLIGTNVAAEFRTALRGRNCLAYNGELRIKIEATGLNTYPDLSVICGPVQLAEGSKDTAVNPSVLVEVLSESTEAYDRGKKFEHYRLIPTLREYLLVSQTEPRIEQFVRQADGRWLLMEATGLEGNLSVPSLGIEIALNEVYANVKFVSGPFRSAVPPATV
jgi:Uma2 family endonuclease